jgi:hypothetical protein
MRDERKRWILETALPIASWQRGEPVNAPGNAKSDCETDRLSITERANFSASIEFCS